MNATWKTDLGSAGGDNWSEMAVPRWISTSQLLASTQSTALLVLQVSFGDGKRKEKWETARGDISQCEYSRLCRKLICPNIENQQRRPAAQQAVPVQLDAQQARRPQHYEDRDQLQRLVSQRTHCVSCARSEPHSWHAIDQQTFHQTDRSGCCFNTIIIHLADGWSLRC